MADEAPRRIVHEQAFTIVLGDKKWSLMTNMFSVGDDPTEYPGIAFYPNDGSISGTPTEEEKDRTAQRDDALVVLVCKKEESVAVLERMAAGLRRLFEPEPVIEKDQP